ncbi:MAG TPA: hypothetical protein VMJ72_01960 [Candidatus Paceibacterota bacterium]|nr:hypothetical protein [Candidatus Paceibacterota bacterium]
MPKSKASKTYIVAIMHEHGDDISTTIGSIDIGPTKKDDKVAAERIKFWLAKQKRLCGCARHGDTCGVHIREAVPSLKTVCLMASAEPIVPAA